ncbi:MAG: hypothetical protein Q9214_000205 [Letrouitia sp. 1 TL-2023]
MSPMYGEDSSGRKVSLLNHEPSATTTTTTTSTTPNRSRASRKSTSTDLPPMSRIDNGLQSSSSSSSRYSSSPETNSRTPPLERHGSVASLGSLSTTSPMTPSYPIDPLDQQKRPSPYYAYSRTNPQLYPALTPASESSVQPYYNLQGQAIPDPELEDPYHINQAPLQPLQTQFSFTDPVLAGLSPTSLAAPLLVATTSQLQPRPRPHSPPTTTVPKSSATAAVAPTSQTTTSPTDSKNIGVDGSNAAAASKPGIKKKFPCPHAARFSCTDTFTTSGHAARHGKKHTGEKSVICPTCNKAFTRKDNMKQHERTHKNNTSRTNDSSSTPKTRAPIASSSSGPRAVTKGTASTASTPVLLKKERLGSLSVPQEEVNGTPTSGSGRFDFVTTPKINMSDNKRGDGRLARGVRVGSFSGWSKEDGEGESPGLDALAPAR